MEVCGDDASCLVDSSISSNVDLVVPGLSVPANSFVQSVLQAFRWVDSASAAVHNNSQNGTVVVPNVSTFASSSAHAVSRTTTANQSTALWPLHNFHVQSAPGIFIQMQKMAGSARATLVDVMFQQHTIQVQGKSDAFIVILFLLAIAVCAMGLFSYINSQATVRGRRWQGMLRADKDAPGLSDPALQPSPRPLPNNRPSTMSLRMPQPAQTGEMSRSSVARVPPSSTHSVAGGPGFVVPQGRVCYLVVRPVGMSEAPRWGYGTAKIEIVDLKGNPMLEGQVKRPISWRDEGPDPIQTPKSAPAVMLHMLQPASGAQQPRSSLVAMGYPSMSEQGQRMMVLYDSNGMYLGSVSLDSSGEGRYVLTAGNSAHQIIFEGSFQRYEVRVTSQNSVRLAHTVPCSMPFEPTGKFYRLSVSAGSDVSLIVRILCTMISIEEMEVGR